MVRIEIKKLVEGQTILGMEIKDESVKEVLICALHGVVVVARRLLEATSYNPEFAKLMGETLKEMLCDTEGIKAAQGVEGKEAKFMAALYGMNTGEEK